MSNFVIKLAVTLRLSRNDLIYFISCLRTVLGMTSFLLSANLPWNVRENWRLFWQNGRETSHLRLHNSITLHHLLCNFCCIIWPNPPPHPQPRHLKTRKGANKTAPPLKKSRAVGPNHCQTNWHSRVKAHETKWTIDMYIVIGKTLQDRNFTIILEMLEKFLYRK